ncbi:unnamed protein product [Callosobruchus maculatus]|uniref:SXP/RAL-2 family protein Ani s 5-like cation-binding domain-containing protein n=1 Tax=Callosobruchus maculatus TaxID=64391 RepID=A0A653BMF2_CALMS|nr:unnamed protein product [Callosobruchus maculatus]
MFKCTAILLLASAALSAAVPIGTYGGIYGVDRYPLYGKTYIGDYTRNILGGYPYYTRSGLGYGWGYDNIYNTIGDVYPAAISDRVVPEVIRKYANGGNIYDVVKKNQLGDLLELNDKHTLEQMYLMAGQNIVRDVLNEQQEKALENKEVLDRLEQVEQIDMQKQKEKLEMMQWMQKLQLDKVHGIEDVKITGHGYPGELL